MDVRTTATVLWHGGAPGRKPGDLLLPPARTGRASVLHAESKRQGRTRIGQRSDRVYVTTQRDWAWAFASMWRRTPNGPMGGGSLYRVEAVDLEPDDDFRSLIGVAYQCKSAVVVSVELARVAFDTRRCTQILTKYIDQHEKARP